MIAEQRIEEYLSSLRVHLGGMTLADREEIIA